MRTLVALLGVFLMAAASPVPADESVARAVAEEVVGQEIDSAVRRFHYPEYETPKELDKDRKGVGELLDFLLLFMGESKNLSGPVDPPALMYSVSVTGGDNPYWASLSPIQTTAYLYEAEFAVVGRGFLAVNLFRAPGSSKIEVRSVGFAIPADSPEAREFAIGMTIGALNATGMPVPDDFEKMLRDTIKPSALPYFGN